MNASVERLLLGRARRALCDIVAFQASPTRIVRLGREVTDLRTEFFGTLVRRSTLADRLAWRGWPDVVWCDHLFSDERSLGPTPLVDQLAGALPAGALVAVLDVLAPGPRDTGPGALPTSLGLRSRAGLLPALRARFDAVHEATFDHHGLWRSFAFVGSCR